MCANDLLAYAIATWIAALAEGGRVGLDLGDLEGASDSVDRRKLLSKLEPMGLLGEAFARFADFSSRAEWPPEAKPKYLTQALSGQRCGMNLLWNVALFILKYKTTYEPQW